MIVIMSTEVIVSNSIYNNKVNPKFKYYVITNNFCF